MALGEGTKAVIREITREVIRENEEIIKREIDAKIHLHLVECDRPTWAAMGAKLKNHNEFCPAAKIARFTETRFGTKLIFGVLLLIIAGGGSAELARQFIEWIIK
jgi:hypothetical protein